MSIAGNALNKKHGELYKAFSITYTQITRAAFSHF